MDFNLKDENKYRKTSKSIIQEICLLEKLLFKTCGLSLSDLEPEAESQDYFAHSFKLNGQNVKFRTAKITPTKTGQFVSIWKRNDKGITEPFSIADDISFFIIATQKETNFGIFIFPKSALMEQKILSNNTIQGKRGIRVYPSWDTTTNKQAQKTQAWQLANFLDLSQEDGIDLEKAKVLLNKKW